MEKESFALVSFKVKRIYISPFTSTFYFLQDFPHTTIVYLSSIRPYFWLGFQVPNQLGCCHPSTSSDSEVARSISDSELLTLKKTKRNCQF